MNNNKTFAALIIVLTIFLFTACNSNEIGDSKDVAQDKIYQDYSVIYNEGDNTAEIFCQYRFGGKNGTTLVLNTPSIVSFDGEKLTVDSNKLSGAYYKTSKPIANFWGNHKFLFTNVDKKQYENSFSFDSFKVNFPTSAAKNKPLQISFETSALGENDYVQINTVNSDSSFSFTNKGNSVIIPIDELKRQTKNEVQLEAHLHRNIPLQQQTTEGGKMYLTYSVKPVKVSLQ